MKALLIHDKDLGAGASSPDAGGLGIYVLELARALTARGLDVETLAFRPGAGASAEPGDDGELRLESFRFRFRRDVAGALERILAQHAPDVVHVHSVSSMHPVLVRLLTRSSPVVWTFHDVSPVCLRRTRLDRNGELCTRVAGAGCVTGGCYRLGSLESRAVDLLRIVSAPRAWRAFASAALITTPSHYLREVLLDHGFEPRRVRVAPLFSRFDEVETGAPVAPTNILFVGRTSREKGVFDLLDAFRRMSSTSASLTFAGDGPEADALRTLVAEHGLDERVRFAGELDAEALRRELEACAVVVMPSLAPESFGLVGVEAMAHERPVVAYDSGGVREWLRDGENGLLARHGDVDHLAACIESVIAAPDVARAMGAAGRELQRARFTRSRHVDRLLECYEAAAFRSRAG